MLVGPRRRYHLIQNQPSSISNFFGGPAMLQRLNEAANNYSGLLMTGIATLNLLVLFAATLLIAVVIVTRPKPPVMQPAATELEPMPVRIVMRPNSLLPVYSRWQRRCNRDRQS